MTLIISKADFTPENFVKFSQNIKNDQIDPYINVSQEYDLQPRLEPELYTDILDAVLTPSSRPELIIYVNTKVKKFLVLSSYYRFITQHGYNVTQFGISSTRDPQGTFDQITGQERAVVLRQVSSDINIALIKMMSEDFIFDGITYGKTKKGSNQNQIIRAPKRTYKTSIQINTYKDILNG